MKPNVVLLLNLAVLVANFILSYGASEAQIHVMRTTARTAYSTPLRPVATARAPERRAGPGATAPEARLVKYLAKLPELDSLSAGQLAAVCGCLDACREMLAGEARRLRGLGGDRGALGAIPERMRRRVSGALLEAGVVDERLRSQLVRIVLSSTG